MIRYVTIRQYPLDYFSSVVLIGGKSNHRLSVTSLDKFNRVSLLSPADAALPSEHILSSKYNKQIKLYVKVEPQIK